MILRLSTSLLLLITSNFLIAQGISSRDSLEIHFVFEFDSIPILLGKPTFYSQGNDTISINRLRFYISNLRWDNSTPNIITPGKNYHLIDAEVPATQRLKLPASASMTSLQFSFGVDSLTNDEGVHGGDLDPTNGMYWAWQTGYINFKLEGKSNSVCKQFTYHLGGFLDGNDASTIVEIPYRATSGSSKLELVFEVRSFLEVANRITKCEIMRPSMEAVLLSEEVKNHFRLRS